MKAAILRFMTQVEERREIAKHDSHVEKRRNAGHDVDSEPRRAQHLQTPLGGQPFVVRQQHSVQPALLRRVALLDLSSCNIEDTLLHMFRRVLQTRILTLYNLENTLLHMFRRVFRH